MPSPKLPVIPGIDLAFGPTLATSTDSYLDTPEGRERRRAKLDTAEAAEHRETSEDQPGVAPNDQAETDVDASIAKARAETLAPEPRCGGCGGALAFEGAPCSVCNARDPLVALRPCTVKPAECPHARAYVGQSPWCQSCPYAETRSK